MLVLARLNVELAQKLKSIHLLAPGPQAYSTFRQAHSMERCIHPLHTPGTLATYCRTPLCLLCRKQRAEERRHQLKQLILATPDLVAFFGTFTLRDCKPPDVKARADLLVVAFRKLRRKRNLKPVRGWVRSIEVKSASPNDDLENVHLHAIWLVPPGCAADVRGIDWSARWRQCADNLARDAEVSVADSREAVLTYLTKSSLAELRKDAEVGIADPLRYVRRVIHGHTKFSSGGCLRAPV